MKKIIGRTDFLDFTELQLIDVPCKIDTGAFMSALHCTYKKVKGDTLYFKIGNHHSYKFPDKVYKTKKYTIKEITSSNGESENRYTIKTTIRIFNEDVETILTLTDRETMTKPVLIGRLALKNYLVDVTQTNLSFQEKYKFS